MPPHLFLQQPLELVLTVLCPHSIRRVYHPDHSVGRLKIVPPVRPQSPLPANVPDVEGVSESNTASPCQLKTFALEDANFSQGTDPLYPKDLMLKPSVGLTVLISSPFSFFKMVVLPALSRPLNQAHAAVSIAQLRVVLE